MHDDFESPDDAQNDSEEPLSDDDGVHYIYSDDKNSDDDSFTAGVSGHSHDTDGLDEGDNADVILVPEGISSFANETASEPEEEVDLSETPAEKLPVFKTLTNSTGRERQRTTSDQLGL